jgi:hypothetical protein
MPGLALIEDQEDAAETTQPVLDVVAAVRGSGSVH